MLKPIRQPLPEKELTGGTLRRNVSVVAPISKLETRLSLDRLNGIVAEIVKRTRRRKADAL